MNINVNKPITPDRIFNIVSAAVSPGKTIKVIIANAPNPTNIGDAVFFEKTFLSRFFIFVVLVSLLKDGWVLSFN